ncbi:MAG: arginine--tRNA ligase [Gammaproteobacteria bacterium]|nr:arginine--tRNA ligase [Gammaproteobacteria bacterium]
MKDQIESSLQGLVDNLIADGSLTTETSIGFQVTRTKDPAHGNFATNIAMILAKPMRKSPRDIANLLLPKLEQNALFERVEIAGPGFINFFLVQEKSNAILQQILDAGEHFGTNNSGKEQSLHIEYVSANPTGPLHVGHGRGAAYGASLAKLYVANGYRVHREYYVNDAGRQMDILATSVWLRYLELCGEELTFPSNGYKGDYVWDIAATAHRAHADQFKHAVADFFAALPVDEPLGGDKEAHIDGLIAVAKKLLGAEGYSVFFDFAIDTILDDIRDDLGLFGVDYDNWYSERSLFADQRVEKVIARLETAGHTYRKDGALWFASSKLGDEKDRVVIRENGTPTYFASDIAYHVDKLEQGYDQIINIWGADHHGYIPRVRAALQALNFDADKLKVLLVQFANLYRGEERLQMSTRSGEFVTLRSLRKEVGCDAARFYYVMRKSEQHLDFDLELAKSTSNENPVYYVQYAHARICSVLRQNQEAVATENVSVELLSDDNEQQLMQKLADYPEVIRSACSKQAPHTLVQYLRELAQRFHNYYNATQFLVDSKELRQARLQLILAVQHVLVNGLAIVGVSAPEKM